MTKGPIIDQDNLAETKMELIDIAKRSFSLGLQTNSGGNLSARLNGGNAIVIKPSGIGFNECTEWNLMVCDLSGNVLEGGGKPSKDLKFHCAIYKVRPEVDAIVHVHSPWAIGYSHLNMPFRCPTVQSAGKLGTLVPCIDLAPGNNPQGAAEVGPVFADSQVKAALLRSHGTIGVGKDLMGAQYIVELLEESIHSTFAATVIKRVYDESARNGGEAAGPGCFPGI